MSLNWDLTEIKDRETVCWIPDPTPEKPDRVLLHPVTEAIIWRTIMPDIGKITEQNVDEFFYRCFVWDRVLESSAILYTDADGNRKERGLTYQEIHAHIGLRTNVFPESTRAKWLKKMTRVMSEELASAVHHEIELAKKSMAGTELHLV